MGSKGDLARAVAGLPWVFWIVALPGTIFATSAVAATGQQPQAQVTTTQRLERSPTPIAVQAHPEIVVVGGQVTLCGSSLVLKDLATVRIEVAPPKGATETLEVKLDKSDAYSTSYRPRVPGRHAVTAFSPDGESRATTSFETLLPGAISKRSTRALTALASSARELAATVCEAAKGLPPSPAQERLVRDGCELVAELEAVPESIESFRQGLVELDVLVEQHPETLVEFSLAYVDLAEIAVVATSAETDLKERVRQLETGITTCDHLDRLVDAYDFLGLVWSLPAAALKRINNLLAGRSLPARVTTQFPGLASSPILKRFVDMGAPTVITAARGVVTKWEYLTQRATSFATLFADLALRAYCEKFVGPVTARLDLEYFEGNARWLAYTVVLTGFVTLRYEQGKASAGGTPVTGEFEGFANFPLLQEDLRVIEPGVAPHVFARKAWPPAMGSIPYPQAELGKFGRAALGALRAAPGYFFVPVEGLIREKTVMLKFRPATVDYPHRALGKIGYVLWSPQVSIPQVFKFDVKYQGAHFILSRAVQKERGTSGEPFALAIVVDEARDVSLIDQRFIRTEEDPGNFHLRWNLQIKACNPACPQ